MRLIDADALLKRLQEQQKYGSIHDGRGRAKAILEVIHAPTITAEQKHGRWKGWTRSCFTGKYADYDEPIFKDYKYYQCSECYRKSAIKELYCQSCGARMDESEVQE